MRDGAIVQLGTPEELVGSPADDYVENFVRDIPRSHVLTLRWIMRDAEPGEPLDGPTVDVGTIVRDAIPMLAASERPLVAVEDGQARRGRRPGRGADGDRRRGGLMSTVTATRSSPPASIAHRPWWRGRPVQVARDRRRDVARLPRAQGASTRGRARSPGTASSSSSTSSRPG